MREANALSVLNPPEYGETVKFKDGSMAVVSQDIGDGWFLMDAGRRICKSGFDMQAFIRAVLAEARFRGAA